MPFIIFAHSVELQTDSMDRLTALSIMIANVHYLPLAAAVCCYVLLLFAVDGWLVSCMITRHVRFLVLLRTGTNVAAAAVKACNNHMIVMHCLLHPSAYALWCCFAPTVMDGDDIGKVARFTVSFS
jgi:hypothetical protein